MPLLTIRLTDEEKQQFDQLIERIQERMPTGVTATQRTTFLAAVEQMNAYLDRLERDKKRPR